MRLKTRKSSTRKSATRGKSRRAGIGGLLEDRVVLHVTKHPSARVNPPLMRKLAKDLCREGHGHYCGKKVQDQAARKSDIEAAFASHVPDRESRQAELEAAFANHVEPVSKAKVRKSEKKAEGKGCVAPKGRVCVGKDVAKLNPFTYRAGCKKSATPGTYTCTEGALKAKAAGKNRRAGKSAPRGFHVSSWKNAIKSNGLFKAGCKFHSGKPICKTGR